MSPLSESRTFLLQGGTLLTHDDKNHVLPQTLDLLIDGSIIAKIAKDIEVDGKYKIIGCHGKIISPGFIDTHRHLYQTQLKGKHANQTLLEYLPPGKFFGGLLPPDDLFLSQLAGALESIDAGTTTVVDHTSGNPTADHRKHEMLSCLGPFIDLDSSLRCYPSSAHVRYSRDLLLQPTVHSPFLGSVGNRRRSLFR